ncbi:MAG: calcium-binding protein, partial [Cycloclasticus sp.]
SSETIWTSTDVEQAIAQASNTIYGTESSDEIIEASEDVVEQAPVPSANVVPVIQQLSVDDGVLGTPADDTLIGTEADDTLIGGYGDDKLYGGGGNNSYYFDAGWGIDVITSIDSSKSQINIIEFSSNINKEAIQLSRSALDLIIDVKGTGDQIRVVDHFKNDSDGSFGINEIQFSDSSHWNRSEISQKSAIGNHSNNEIYMVSGDHEAIGNGGSDTIYGSEAADLIDGGAGYDIINAGGGDDSLIGGSSNDTLNAGSGDDYIEGGYGNDNLTGGLGSDKYFFDIGFGEDRIFREDITNDQSIDRIIFSENVKQEHVEYIKSGNNLTVNLLNTNDKLIIDKFFIVDNENSVFVLVFTNGATLTAADVNKQLIKVSNFDDNVNIVGKSDDVIFAKLGNDTINAGAGNDYLSGQEGHDVLNGEDGDDTLLGGYGNDTLKGGFGDDTLIGQYGNNTLEGGAGDDYFISGVGSDKFIGGAESDTYFFDKGFGKDFITDYSVTEELAIDRISFGEGITPELLQLYMIKGDKSLHIKLKDSEDHLEVAYFQLETEDEIRGIQQIKFFDGTTWGLDDIKENTFSATDSSDVIRLLNGDVSVDGGLGDDDISGSSLSNTILGGEGNDRLTGYAGNDLLIGGAGNDAIYGSATRYEDYDEMLGTNTLIGGTGDDRLYGGDFDDVYVFDLGWGHDRIYVDSSNQEIGKNDIIKFGSEIKLEDIEVSQNHENIFGVARNIKALTISHKDTGDSITVSFSEIDNEEPFKEVQFSDGRVLSYSEVRNMAFSATDSNDRIFSSSLNTSISGGAGNDVLIADESISATLYGDFGYDTLEGSELTDILYGGQGDDKLLGSGGDDTLIGGSGFDALYGSYGNDLIEGGSGNDYLAGDTGNDTYFFESGFGQDIISGNAAGTDRIVFSSDLKFDDFNIIRMDSNLVLQVNDGSEDRISIRNYFTTSTIKHVDEVEFSDGVVISITELASYAEEPDFPDSMTGHTLTGNTGDDEYISGTGYDQFSDYSGNDTFNFSKGFGKDKINLDWQYGNRVREGSATLIFDQTISKENIQLQRFPLFNSLLVKDISTGDSVEINGYFDDTPRKVVVKFSDGTIWNELDVYNSVIVPTTSDDIVYLDQSGTIDGSDGADRVHGSQENDDLSGGRGSDTLDGGEGDDWLNGGSGDDTLIGGTGNDTLVGGYGDDSLESGLGSDTYIYNIGDGDDIIHGDSFSASKGFLQENETLIFGEGITEDLVVISSRIPSNPYNPVQDRTYMDVIITFKGLPGSITISGFNYQLGIPNDIPDSNAKLVFANGLVWDISDIVEKLTSGSNGDDTLNVKAGVYSLNGGAGDDILLGHKYVSTDDVLVGGTGNDSLVGFAGNDSLYGGAGDDYLSGGDGRNYLDGGQGDDNLSVDASSEESTLIGGTGDDTLSGGEWFEGGEGDDSIYGLGGNDTYVFDTGFGNDYIETGRNTDNQVIRFSKNISPNDVHYKNNYNDLIIGLYGTDDTITVRNYFIQYSSGDGYNYAIEEIRFANGVVHTPIEVNALLTNQIQFSSTTFKIPVVAELSNYKAYLKLNDEAFVALNKMDGAYSVEREHLIVGHYTIALEYRDEQGNIVYRTNDTFEVYENGSHSQLSIAEKISSADNGRITEYRYDASGQLIKEVDAEGFVSSFDYDNAGNLLKQTQHKKPLSSIDEAIVKSSEDLIEHHFYNASGKRIASINSKGYLTETIHNQAANKQSFIQYGQRIAMIAEGASLDDLRVLASNNQDRTLVKEFSTTGELGKEIDHQDSVTEYLYDTMGRLLSKTSGLAENDTSQVRINRIRYDAFGRKVGELNAVGSKLFSESMSESEVDALYKQYGTTYQYNELSQLVSTTDANNLSTYYFYDSTGQIRLTVNGKGEASELTYNNFGEIIQQRRYANRLITLGLSGGAFNADMQAKLQNIADSQKDTVTLTSYDKRGLLASKTNAAGLKTDYQYNAFSELSKQTSYIKEGATTDRFAYNKLGALISSVSDQSDAQRFEYDAFGRLIVEYDALANKQAIVYLQAGNVIETTNPLNQKEQTRYDAFNRVLEKIVLGENSQANQVTQYQYNDTDASYTVVSPQGVATTFKSNRHGEQVEIIDGNGLSTRYAYSALGLLEKVSKIINGNEVQLSKAEYDQEGRLVNSIDGNGIRTLTEYDLVNRIVRTTQDADGAPIINEFSYDALGNQIEHKYLNSQNNATVDRTFYDNAGRVKARVIDAGGLAQTTLYRYNMSGSVINTVELQGFNQSMLQASTVYSTDANGFVTETILDNLGEVSEVRYYDQAINADGVETNEDFAQALTGTEFETFANNAGNFVRGHSANTPELIAVENGQVRFSNGVTETNSTVGIYQNVRAYEAGQGYRAEISMNDIAADRNFYVGLDNAKSWTDTEHRRHMIRFTSTGVYSYERKDGISVSSKLGSLDSSATYVVEMETLEASTAMYVYEKGQTRADGWSHSLVGGDWGDIRARAYASTGATKTAGSEVYMDNYMEYAAGTSAEFQSEKHIYSTDANGFVTETILDNLGEVSEVRYYDQAINADGVETNEDFAQALTGTEFETFANNAGNFVRGHSANTPELIAVENGQVRFSNGVTETNSTVGIYQNVRAYEAGQGYRAEISMNDIAADRNFYVGLDNAKSWTDTEHRRHMIRFTSTGVYSYERKDGISVSSKLGSLDSSATYVVEMETLEASTAMYVYEKGQTRADGWSHSLVGGDWGDIRARAYASTGATKTAGSEVYMDNYMEYAVDAQATYTKQTKIIEPIVLERSLATQYVFDKQQNLVQQVLDTQNKSITTDYEYNDNNQVIYTLDALGAQTRYVYDQLGRLQFEINDFGVVTEYGYDRNGNKVYTVNYAKEVVTRNWQHEVDAGQVVDRLTDSVVNNKITRHVFNADNQHTYSLDAQGYVTQQKYDANGNVVERIKFDEAISLDEYILSESDIATALTDLGYGISNTKNSDHDVYFYDELNRMIFSVDTLGGVTHFEYDLNGNVLQQDTLVSNTTLSALLSLSTAGALEQLETQLAAVQLDSLHFFYTAQNQLEYQIDQAGYVTYFEYDAQHNLVKQTQYENAINVALINEKQDVTSQLLPSSADKISSFEFDTLGRNISSIDAEGYTSQKYYDALGRVVANQDNNGNLTRLILDNIGNVRFSIDAEGGVTERRYNALSQVIETLEYSTAVSLNGLTEQVSLAQITARLTPNSILDTQLFLAYDKSGREVYRVDSDGYVTETRHHGELGQLTDGQQVLTESYDQRVIDTLIYRKSIPLDTVMTQQGIHGALERLGYSVDHWHLVDLGDTIVSRQFFDESGREVYAIGPDGKLTLTQYNSLGNIERQAIFSNVVDLNSLTNREEVQQWMAAATLLQQTINEYDSNGLLLSQVSGFADTKVATRTWYNAEGQSVATEDQNGNQTRRVYNDKNQLAYTVQSDGSVTRWNYNAAGYVQQETRFAMAVELTGFAQEITVGQIESRLILSANDQNDYRIYDRTGRVIYTLNGMGAVSENQYDGNGNLVLTLEYDRFIDLAAVQLSQVSIEQSLASLYESDERNTQRHAYYYDANNRLRFDVNSIGLVTERVYDVDGKVVEKIVYHNTVDSTGIDTLESLEVSVIEGGNDRHQQSFYDNEDQLRFEIDEEGNITEYRYDEVSGSLNSRIQHGLPNFSDLNLSESAFYHGAIQFKYHNDYLVGVITEENKEIQVFSNDGHRLIQTVSGISNEIIGTNEITLVNPDGHAHEFYGWNSDLEWWSSPGAGLSTNTGSFYTNYTVEDTVSYQRLNLLEQLSIDGDSVLNELEAVLKLEWKQGSSSSIYSHAARSGASMGVRFYDKNMSPIGNAHQSDRVFVEETDLANWANRSLSIDIPNGARYLDIIIDLEKAYNYYPRVSQITDIKVEVDIDEFSVQSSDRVEFWLNDAASLNAYYVDAEGFVSLIKQDISGREISRHRYNNFTLSALDLTGKETFIEFDTKFSVYLDENPQDTHDQSVYTLYNAVGQVSHSIDAEGYVTEYVRDAVGNALQETRYAQALTEAQIVSLDLTSLATQTEKYASTKVFDSLNR